MNSSIKTYSTEELIKLMSELGQPSFRAKQLYEWLHTHHATSYEEMTNLPRNLRERLAESHPLFMPRVIDKQRSTEGTCKYVLSLNDGTLVEAVGIPTLNTDGTVKRLSVCLSTQVGCAMGCLFCATGQEGFTRNLTAEEIVDQAVVIQRDFNSRISNVVVMGQGEPFLNYNELIPALRMLNDPLGFKIGARHITVSTCGILNGIRRFSREPEQFTLAVSLHSAIQWKRNLLMPQVANYPLEALKKELKSYIDKTGRRVTLEYLLIKDLNDQTDDINALVDFCRGLLCHVNLLTMNAIKEESLEPSDARTTAKWEQELKNRKIEATVRQPRGVDISGACGQLKNEIA